MGFNRPTEEQVRQIFTQFDEIKFLKKGGFKAVYKVSTKGNIEAFKIVFIPVYGQAEISSEVRKESFARVKREIKILNNCKSPEIVKLGTIQPTNVIFGEQEFIAYTEEYLDGHNLRELIKKKIMPSEHEVRLLLLSLLKAIREFWSLGVIHRDIKPENIIKLGLPERNYVLIDLGIAFSIIDTPLTFDAQHRMPPGTFRYLAPEMLQPNFRESIDFRSDLYAAAVTVYEYAAGRHPLAKNEDDLITTLSRIIKEPPKSLKEFRDDLSVSIVQIIDQMLKKIPALRPSNLNMLIKNIEDKI
jgi:serine/threonine protein kinase